MGDALSYGGDDALSALLEDAALTLSVDDIREIVRGVIAAPRAVNPDAWQMLIGERLPETLVLELSGLLAYERNIYSSDLDAKHSFPERLVALRKAMEDIEIQGFLVPLSDAFQSEFPPLYAQRLAWLTGFTGSAGLAVVLKDKAAIFVDGRYTIQVRDQVDVSLFELQHLTEMPPADWLATNACQNMEIGYDPWLHTSEGLKRLRDGCERGGAKLVPVASNPLDLVWTNQPAQPLSLVEVHPTEFAGRSSADKRQEIARKITDNGVQAVVLTAPDSIAWLLNIRGGDIPNTPIALCFAVVYQDERVNLFIDTRKLTSTLETHLGDGITVIPLQGFGDSLDQLGGYRMSVQLSPVSAPAWVIHRLEAAGAKIVRKLDPCVLPKACKNLTELSGARAAHIRDGAALTRFLAWLASEAPKGIVDELTAVDRLYECRAGGENFRGLSFDTISGAGPNGAIVHYRARPDTNRKLELGSLYLVDSGAQYLDGTTDVTRTVAIGQPTVEMRDRFTRVLKGHIAIATAKFPIGTSGEQLDTLARQALWQVGLDFDHGTGHGVGSYLGVHEGPQRIAKRFADTPLRLGMIVSNEPGYYKTGEYGIRIENLQIVNSQSQIDRGECQMLGFETLTLAPIDLTLVEVSMLTDHELVWLNAYHAKVREIVGPLVYTKTAKWLNEATKPIVPESV